MTLELHKILELLANECSSEMSKKLALKTHPIYELSKVKKEIEENGGCAEERNNKITVELQLRKRQQEERDKKTI